MTAAHPRLPAWCARHQVPALSREVAGAREGQALATSRSEVATESDKLVLSARGDEKQKVSVRQQLQVVSAEQALI